MKREMPLQISDHVRTLGREAQAALGEQFARIDAIAEENTQKVLAAFQRHRVAESYFAGTTGYGYDDLGRDQLDAIFADLFGTEDALVRIGFVNGTHAISCALFGALKPGDTLGGGAAIGGIEHLPGERQACPDSHRKNSTEDAEDRFSRPFGPYHANEPLKAGPKQQYRQRGKFCRYGRSHPHVPNPAENRGGTPKKKQQVQNGQNNPQNRCLSSSHRLTFSCGQRDHRYWYTGRIDLKSVFTCSSSARENTFSSMGQVAWK